MKKEKTRPPGVPVVLRDVSEPEFLPPTPPTLSRAIYARNIQTLPKEK